MSLREKQTAFAWKIADFLLWCKTEGYDITFGEVYRTIEQQQHYVQIGRSKTMHSKHLDRLAVDLNLFIDGKLATAEQYRPLGEEWESRGGRWGGRFGVNPDDYSAKVGWDSNHFEMGD